VQFLNVIFVSYCCRSDSSISLFSRCGRPGRNLSIPTVSIFSTRSSVTGLGMNITFTNNSSSSSSRSLTLVHRRRCRTGHLTTWTAARRLRRRIHSWPELPASDDWQIQITTCYSAKAVSYDCCCLSVVRSVCEQDNSRTCLRTSTKHGRNGQAVTL